jgi:hypothetical protein
MIGVMLAFVVLPAAWLAFEAYRAPIAFEGPHGLSVIEPGRRWEDLFPLKSGGLSPLVFWGLA